MGKRQKRTLTVQVPIAKRISPNEMTAPQPNSVGNSTTESPLPEADTPPYVPGESDDNDSWIWRELKKAGWVTVGLTIIGAVVTVTTIYNSVTSDIIDLQASTSELKNKQDELTNAVVDIKKDIAVLEATQKHTDKDVEHLKLKKVPQ